MWHVFVAPGWSLIKRTKWFREAWLDTSTIKHLVVVECRKNLSILDPLCLDDDSMAQDASAFVAVAKRLEYAAIEILLATDDKAKKTLRELQGLELQHEEAESDGESSNPRQGGQTTKSVGELLIRLYIRMHSLRVLGEILGSRDGPKTGIRKIHFRTRLKNVREALVMVTKSLDEKATVSR
jgi:hypothetical protein